MTLMILLSASSVSATNFSGATGATGCPMSDNNMADNRDHYFWYDSLTVNVASAVNWSRTNNFDPTRINTFYDSSENSTTDAIVRDQDYTTYCGYTWHDSGSTGGVNGLATCNSLNGVSECESHVLRYDTSFFDGASLSFQRHVACHEVGHSLGLKHRSENGCMTSSATAYTSLTSHDNGHLNDTSNY